MKPRIYCAGPYRHPDPLSNARHAIAVGSQIRDSLGVIDDVPHLSLLEDMMFPRPPEYWLDVTMERMRRCDAVYRYSMRFSPGSDAEIAEAERLGIPCFFDMEKLAQWVKEWKVSHAV